MNCNWRSALALAVIVGLGVPGCGTSPTRGAQGFWGAKPRTARDAALDEIHRLRGRVILDPEDMHIVMINLRGTLVTDDELSFLARLKGVRALSLNGTQITDAGLAHLQGQIEVETLDLGLTRITDAGMKQLRKMTKLRVLSLMNTGVSDAGLRYLQAMPQLEQQNVVRTGVTVSGIRDLQEALPRVQVQRDVDPGRT
jgi:hypothetical protein